MEQVNIYNFADIARHLENCGIAVQSFRGLANYNVAQHRHDILEMLFIKQGQANQRLEQSETILSRGCLTIINYGQSHNLYIGSEQADLINIYVDFSKANFNGIDENLKTKLREILPLHPAFGHKLNKVIQLQVEQSDEFIHILEAIESEQNLRREGYETIIKAYFSIALSIISRSAQKFGTLNPDIQDSSYYRMEKLFQFIDENLDKPLDLGLLAGHIGLSRHYLCREFKRATSKTLMRYITQRRIEKAMFELRSTDKKIIDIALDAGFNDYSNFTRCFRQTAGSSPRLYRKKFRPA
ncbi:Regulatory protein SoxS [Limihaloglobus sulfuriphilus]|uniref:Regulatory protein SoxS n=1 Tax=Limihaloglobus sulfuriphilus TaxID=1851148 RepID=A0A1Q2MFB7_9BACT|nr:AraC family transcriptional regulator [Limihaloglobus sulfuriphilus]AQQ71344.1 Regulatory protein SoxS [Limihaloglobus sulfuriphilus]